MPAKHMYILKDRPIPHEGTLTRKLYDLSMTGRAFDRSPFNKGTWDSLKNFHGFEYVKEAPGWWRAVGRFGAGGYTRIWPEN